MNIFEKNRKKNVFFQNWFRIFQNVFLTIKADFDQFFPVENFSLGLYHFWRKWPKSEKISGQKITKMSFRRVPQRALKRPIFKIFWPSLRSGRLRRLCRYVSSATGRRGITLTSKEDAGKPIPPSSSPEVDQGRLRPESYASAAAKDASPFKVRHWPSKNGDGATAAASAGGARSSFEEHDQLVWPRELNDGLKWL